MAPPFLFSPFLFPRERISVLAWSPSFSFPKSSFFPFSLRLSIEGKALASSDPPPPSSFLLLDLFFLLFHTLLFSVGHAERKKGQPTARLPPLGFLLSSSPWWEETCRRPAYLFFFEPPLSFFPLRLSGWTGKKYIYFSSSLFFFSLFLFLFFPFGGGVRRVERQPLADRFFFPNLFFSPPNPLGQ